MGFAQIPILFAACIASCVPSTSLPLHSEFQVGSPRSEIRKMFGTPHSVNSIQKQNDVIWGAIESFWGRVPVESTVEIWSYRSQNPPIGEGHTELYFVDGSDTVDGLGFSPADVVYESNRDAW